MNKVTAKALLQTELADATNRIDFLNFVAAIIDTGFTVEKTDVDDAIAAGIEAAVSSRTKEQDKEIEDLTQQVADLTEENTKLTPAVAEDVAADALT